jgi:prepilin-type N-terminal cleavage/methylation domain-containing protein
MSRSVSVKKQFGFTVIELVVAVIVLAGAGGYIANIVKLVGLLDGSVTAWLVARAVGIFAFPLGAILGFF